MKKRQVAGLLVLTGGIAAAIGGYLGLLRPRFNRWGATSRETEMYLPGDELAALNAVRATHVVEIDADVESVWPWFIQIGQGRGGFYSYTVLQNLAGSSIRNVEDMTPTLQDLKEGDAITLHPSVPALRVVNLDPPQNLVLQGDSNDATSIYNKIVWSFHLRPHGRNSSRVIARIRVNRPSRLDKKLATAFFFEPAHFVMERKMLLTIKALAERASSKSMTPNF